ncbi:MAG: response regulator transcription factor [Methylomicrobium sp.]
MKPTRPLELNKDVVLVIDDSPDTLSMLNDTLDRAGFAVLVALEGSQALTILNNISPDIILLDALMPHMDGFETCKKLKQERNSADIPVIFMTGLSDSESIVKGLEAGGVDYVTKPVNAEELIARIRVHLANARLTKSARAALDSAGQYLFSIDLSGRLLWATPQAIQLFADSGLNTESLDESLIKPLRLMLSPQYNKEKAQTINLQAKSLEMKYIGRTGNEEYLIRIVDSACASEEDILRTNLSLTEREAQVLLWVAKGKTNREIGSILDMSPRTVNKHLEQVFKKIGVENRTSAAVVALKYLNS